MLRRALALTAIAVALSAAGALAFAPSLSLASHTWNRGGMWSRLGFTPVPASHDPHALANDSVLQNEGRAPGTYCPTRPHDPNAGAAVTADQRMSTDPALTSS